jgi:hypothetical protein
VLAPELSSTRTQMSAQVSAAQAVTRYAHAVVTLVPAYATAVTDPNLGATLQSIEQNAATWTGGLCATATQVVPALFGGFNTAFQAALEQMLADVQQLTGDPSNPAARAGLVQQLQQLVAALQPLGGQAAALQTALAAFQGTVQADHASMESALQALEDTQPETGAVIRSAQAALTPGFVASQQLSPCIVIVELDAQVAIRFTAVAGTVPQVAPVVLCHALLNALATQNESGTQALSGLLDTWAVVTGKYQAAVQALAEAEASQVGSILQELALQASGEAWQQLAGFAASIIQSTPSGQATPTSQIPQSFQTTAGAA